MPHARNGEVEIYYEVAGDPSGVPILMIMGLGAQLVSWPPELVARLVELGYFVIRFDNRDVGSSSWLDRLGVPDFAEMRRAFADGRSATVPYSLRDMALDALSVLDDLDLKAAHIVGASLGGMVGQRLAIDHPARVLSLTSFMSTTGSSQVPPSQPDVWATLTRPRATDRAQAIEASVESFRRLAVTPSDFDEQRTRETVALAIERGMARDGFARQLAAVLAGGDREPDLSRLRIPCLVLHGELDPLISVQGAHRTHRCISGSRLVTFPEMGHYVPSRVIEPIASEVHALIQSTRSCASR